MSHFYGNLHRQKADSKKEDSLPSAFVVVGRFAANEERLVLSKPVVQFSFSYGVSRGIFIFVYTSITGFFIYWIMYAGKH